MDFRYDTDQVDFRQSVRDFLGDAAPLARVRQIAGTTGHDERLWQRVCRELELPGLHVPVEYGGVGATLVESSIAFEELGRALTPTPLATHMFAVNAILVAGDEEQRHRLLPGLLGGARIAAFASQSAIVSRSRSSPVTPRSMEPWPTCPAISEADRNATSTPSIPSMRVR